MVRSSPSSARLLRPGIKDVAATSGVSVGTASDALNGKGRMAASTRERIHQVANELGYRPNSIGRSLRRNRTGVVGLSLRFLSGSPLQYLSVGYYTRLLGAATAAALQHDYALVALPPDATKILDSIAIDGVIVADPAPDDSLFDELDALGIPYVSALGRPDRTGALYVDNDQEQAITGVCDHLVAQGARRVGLLTANGSDTHTERSIGAFRRWCSSAGLPPRLEMADVGESDSMRAAAQRLLSGRDAPDALYSTEAPFGRHMLAVASAAHMEVPGDLLIACCAEEVDSDGHDPPLTTLSLNAERVASEAVDLLITALTDAHVPRPHRIVPTTLHVRASTGGCRGPETTGQGSAHARPAL